MDTEGFIETIILEEVGVGFRDRQHSDNIRRNDRNSSRSTSGSRASTNRDRFRCYKCMEYDHFIMGCPNLHVEKESEQIQHMYKCM